jgi:hypothetical protein
MFSYNANLLVIPFLRNFFQPLYVSFIARERNEQELILERDSVVL